MSGGSLDYAFYKIEDIACQIRDKRSDDPMVEALAAHLDKAAAAVKALEWWWSGDTDRSDAESVIRAVISRADELKAATRKAETALFHLQQTIQQAKDAT